MCMIVCCEVQVCEVWASGQKVMGTMTACVHTTVIVGVQSSRGNAVHHRHSFLLTSSQIYHPITSLCKKYRDWMDTYRGQTLHNNSI